MAARRVDMYGIKSVTLEESRLMVEKTLGIELEEQYSSHFENVSLRYREQPFKEIRLYSNFDATGSGFIYEHLREFSVLINVAGLDGMDRIQKLLLSCSVEIELIGSSTIDTNQPKRQTQIVIPEINVI